MKKPFYHDRRDAAGKLSNFLSDYKDSETVIVSIPNGGLPIGKILSEELKLPLFWAPIKKIKHPDTSEVNIGALSMNNYILDPDMDISVEDVKDQIADLRSELKQELEKIKLYKNYLDLKNKKVIITDDGITTGSTMMATLQLIEMEDPQNKVLAVPVATYRSLNKLRDYVDDVVCLHITETVDKVAEYYESFEDLSETDIRYVLTKAEDQ